MGAIFPVIILVVLVLVGAFLVVLQLSRRSDERRRTLEQDAAALRYVVPDGQDTAVVLAELDKAGYSGTVEENGTGGTSVLIGADGGETPDRERVRGVLSGMTRVNFEGDVAELPSARFADE